MARSEETTGGDEADYSEYETLSDGVSDDEFARQGRATQAIDLVESREVAALSGEEQLTTLDQLLSDAPYSNSWVLQFWQIFESSLPELLKREVWLKEWRRSLDTVDDSEQLMNMAFPSSLRSALQKEAMHLARKNLKMNDALASQELVRYFGDDQVAVVHTLSGPIPLVSPGNAKHEANAAALQELQQVAGIVVELDHALGLLRKVPIGLTDLPPADWVWSEQPGALEGAPDEDEVEDREGGLWPVTFDPTDERQEDVIVRPLTPWATVKGHWDTLNATRDQLVADYPLLLAIIRQGQIGKVAEPGSEFELATTVQVALGSVRKDIKRLQEKLDTIDYREFDAVLSRLRQDPSASEGTNPWSSGIHRFIIDYEVAEFESTEAWKDLALGAAGVALAATALASGWAGLPILAAAAGATDAAIAIGVAGRSWDEAMTHATARNTALREELDLVSGEKASNAQLAAVLDTVFAFLAVIDIAADVARLSRSADVLASGGLRGETVGATPGARRAGSTPPPGTVADDLPRVLSEADELGYGEELTRLYRRSGRLSSDEAGRLLENPEVLVALDESPQAERLLRRCWNPCGYPDHLTVDEVREVDRLAQKGNVQKGSAEEAAIKEHLETHDPLDDALNQLQNELNVYNAGGSSPFFSTHSASATPKLKSTKRKDRDLYPPDKEWKRLVKDTLKRDPICAFCQSRKSVTADHVEPRVDARMVVDAGMMTESQARAAVNSPDNLRGICKPCNSAKSGYPVGDMKNLGEWVPPNPDPAVIEHMKRMRRWNY